MSHCEHTETEVTPENKLRCLGCGDILDEHYD